MGYENEMKIEFDSRSCNEGFIRVAVSAFMDTAQSDAGRGGGCKDSSFRSSHKLYRTCI